MELGFINYLSRQLRDGTRGLWSCGARATASISHTPLLRCRFINNARRLQTINKRQELQQQLSKSRKMAQPLLDRPKGMRLDLAEPVSQPIELQLLQGVWERHQLSRKILGTPAFSFPSKKCDSYCTFASFSDGTTIVQTHYIRQPSGSIVSWEELGIPNDELPEKLAWKEIYLQGAEGIAEPTLTLDQLSAEDREAFEARLEGKHIYSYNSESPSKKSLKRQSRVATQKENRKAAIARLRIQNNLNQETDGNHIAAPSSKDCHLRILMTSDTSKPAPDSTVDSSPAKHRPLVVGLTKPSTPSNVMASSEAAAALNKEIEKNVQSNTKSAAPAEESPAQSSQPKQKKEKAPKQPKAQKPAAPTAPTSPALIDLRVGHILRAIAHPNADSLYVSTIAMGDPEGTEHTQVDEETGKVVRTVCSGLNGLIPLAEMQDRKIIVVANLKPVNMRSIKSAAMVLAASPKQEEGADPHAADRVVELVIPPAGSEAGDKVYFEGWPYGDGKGPEKQLNPKKKQWEVIQPGFYTSDDLVVGFDAAKCEEVHGSDKGNLVVEGKGVCTVKTLKGAVVR